MVVHFVALVLTFTGWINAGRLVYTNGTVILEGEDVALESLNIESHVIGPFKIWHIGGMVLVFIMAIKDNQINFGSMDRYEQIEFDSEAYTSIWLIQKLLSGCNADKVLESVGISEIQYILRNPHIFLVRNRQRGDIIDDLKFLVRGNCKGRLIPASQKETPGVNMTRPFAIVFMLRVEGRHGECCLNLEDYVLVDEAKTFLRRKEDVVYIMKYNVSQVTYDETDLHNVSEEIQQRIYGKNNRNRIFPNLFFMHDEQIQIRIGLCLHSSILCHLKQTFPKIQRIIRTVQMDLTKLQQKQLPCIESIKNRISNTCFKVSSYTSLGTKRTVNDILCLPLLKCLERFAGGRIWSLDNMPSVVMDIVRARLYRFFIPINPPCSRYITRSKAKQFKCNGTSAKVRRKSKENVHQCKTSCIYVWTERQSTSIAKVVYKMSLKAISQSVAKYLDKLSALCRNIQDEYTKRGDNVTLHEWKIVTERNRQIKGFGYVDGRITINITKDDENCKEEVSTYLQKYFDMTKYRVSIVYKNRKFIPFSNLEQGSRINREDAEKYGTLGMFFKDNTETYFFTTCAHVIGENAFAYSHTDNTRIGKNVYICDSGTSVDTQESHMDFSLIEVSPERSLTCTFGLKAFAGNFIEGNIFHGDLSEVRHRTVYKWGATKPYIRQGKCTGYDSDGAVLVLQIDTQHFARPGDSGAIICIGDNPELGLAAFVLVGGDTDDETEVTEYAVYKVSEAIDKVSELRREITPCFIPCKKTISITESLRETPQSTQKRKGDDLPVVRQKRLSPNKSK